MKALKLFLLIGLTGNLLLYADPNADLLTAANSGNLQNTKKALLAKADIHFKDASGKNALMYAVESGDYKVVQFLVENSSDLLTKTNSGQTASMLAKEKGNATIQVYLEGLERELLNSKATGVVTFVTGDVFEGNRKLKTGDIILENRTIYVRKKSICDLQIKQSLSNVAIRLKENSVFTLKYQKVEDKNIFSAFVKYGGALFNVGKLKGEEKLQTFTPTLVAAVRGTIYEVTMDNKYNTKLNTYAGSVQARVRAPEAEGDESVSTDQNIENLIQKLEANSQIVEKGTSLYLTKSKQENVLKKADADNAYQRAIRKEDLPSNGGLSLRDAEKPEISGLKESEIKTKIKEAGDMTITDSVKLKDASENSEVISILKKHREEKMVETFQPEILKAPETIRLKNGKKIKGSIYQIGTKYILFSNDGKKSIYEQSEVEEFVFE